MTSAVRIDQDGAVAVVVLNRPEARNALRVTDKVEIARVIEQLSTTGARAIVLVGSGNRAFCAGSDIKEMAEFTIADGAAMLRAEALLFDTILRAPIPILAAVNGIALGAGCVLAYCCDLAVATAGATFGQPRCETGCQPLSRLLCYRR